MRFAAPALLLLAACGAPPEGVRPGAPASETPLPFLSAAPPQEAPALPKLSPAAPPALMAGDLLEIRIYQQPDMDLTVRIPPSGAFSFPLVGGVDAAGRTAAAVEKTLRDKLEKDFLHEPSVTVTVKEYARRMVYVLGGVLKPDGYELRPAQRLTVLQLIATAGGYTDRAYKEYAQLVRRKENGEREVIRFSVADVEKAVARGRAEADLELSPDDLLVVPSAARVIYVLGQVNKPGSFELPSDTRFTVSMAISQAGSWTKFASIGRIQVLRQPPTGEPVKMIVNLDEIVNGRLDQDVELRPGDVVWVPERGLF